MPRRSPLTRVTRGAFHRDIGAGAHRDADLRLGQRRRVVDAVAGHRDKPALRLAGVSTAAAFSVGQHLGHDLIDAELLCDRLGRDAAVAGQHDDPDALGAQRGERLCGARLDRVGDGEETRRPAVERDQHDALSLPPQLVGARGECRRVDAERRHQRGVADRDPPAVDHAVRAFAGLAAEFGRRGEGEAALLAPATIAAASGCSLARSRLAARRSSSSSATAPSARPPSQAGLAFGQRAGLVDDQRVDLFQQFERFGVA